MDAYFECVWEELRPAPRVHIDFGNGYTLDRTLTGNVATLFCTPGGRVFDVLPGIMTYDSYIGALKLTAFRYSSMKRRNQDPELHRQLVLEDLQERGNQTEWTIPWGMTDFNVAASKFAVEEPIKEALPHMSNLDEANLTADTETVFKTLLPQSLKLLETMPLCKPEQLTTRLFLEVLHVDLEDPYLGLAPDVLGGRLGRNGPEDMAGTPATEALEER